MTQLQVSQEVQPQQIWVPKPFMNGYHPGVTLLLSNPLQPEQVVKVAPGQARQLQVTAAPCTAASAAVLPDNNEAGPDSRLTRLRMQGNHCYSIMSAYVQQGTALLEARRANPALAELAEQGLQAGFAFLPVHMTAGLPQCRRAHLLDTSERGKLRDSCLSALLASAAGLTQAECCAEDHAGHPRPCISHQVPQFWGHEGCPPLRALWPACREASGKILRCTACAQA